MTTGLTSQNSPRCIFNVPGPSDAALFSWSPDNLRLLVAGDYSDHPTLWDVPGGVACAL